MKESPESRGQAGGGTGGASLREAAAESRVQGCGRSCNKKEAQRRRPREKEAQRRRPREGGTDKETEKVTENETQRRRQRDGGSEEECVSVGVTQRWTVPSLGPNQEPEL